jgi:RNA polymerase sigma-70 factor (ECF subfamily)
VSISGHSQAKLDYRQMSDHELAHLCAARDGGAVRHVITSNNQRLFRTAWSILKNRAEAEEAVQAAYVAAFASIGSFEGRSALSTWLTRIVVNEALSRRRSEERRRRQLEQEGVAVMDSYRDALMRGSDNEPPDAAFAREQAQIARARGWRASRSVPHRLRVARR